MTILLEVLLLAVVARCYLAWYRRRRLELELRDKAERHAIAEAMVLEWEAEQLRRDRALARAINRLRRRVPVRRGPGALRRIRSRRSKPAALVIQGARREGKTAAQARLLEHLRTAKGMHHSPLVPPHRLQGMIYSQECMGHAANLQAPWRPHALERFAAENGLLGRLGGSALGGLPFLRNFP